MGSSDGDLLFHRRERGVMTKKEFLSILEQELDMLPREERNRTIIYYEELIEDRMEDGMTEEEAVRGIGNPKQLAKEVIEENEGELWEKIENPNHSLGAKIGIWAVILLGSPLWASILFALILCILSGYLVIWTVPLIGASFTLAFGVIGVYGVISFPFAVFDGVGIGIFHLGTGMLGLGLMLIFALSTLWMSKKIIYITWKFTKFISSRFRRRRGRA